MPAWLSGSIGIIILVAAIFCRKQKRLQNFTSAAFLSAGLFLAYTLFVLYLTYR
ncbi:hypothetical protein SDC9_139062 [bioreactor metagenome]|uniref:Uncharacterized protein n=1 Tax=bioreactor metagenome TaxID=1076179 RepID=A0A645DS29_9ZZZZ|nr:hypothetical protein [Candidatus Pelethousia sp.]